MTAGGTLIRELREAQGLNQNTLAMACGVDRSLISYIEAGKRTPSDTLLTGLADLLKADLDELAVGCNLVPPDLRDRLATDIEAVRLVRSVLPSIRKGEG